MEIELAQLDETAARAIARPAEAGRMQRAKVIAAEGELQASEPLELAARALQSQDQATTQRYPHTIVDISTEQTATVLFTVPLNLLGALRQAVGGADTDPGR